MNKSLYDILNNYELLIYYDEIRTETDELVFCNGHSFNEVSVDDITGFIILENKKDKSSRCLVNPCLDCTIIAIDYCMDKVILSSGSYRIIFFAKKNKKNSK